MKNGKWLRKQRFDREPKGNTVSYPRHKRTHIKLFKILESPEFSDTSMKAGGVQVYIWYLKHTNR